MRYDEIIKSLTPAQLEKLNACKSGDEIIALAKDADIELDVEVLDAIAGGASEGETDGCLTPKCKKCGSEDVSGEFLAFDTKRYTCHSCGYHWDIFCPC